MSFWLRPGSPGSSKHPVSPWQVGFIPACSFFLSKGSETSQLCQRELPLGGKPRAGCRRGATAGGELPQLGQEAGADLAVSDWSYSLSPAGSWHRSVRGSGSGWHCSASLLRDNDFSYLDRCSWLGTAAAGRAELDAAHPVASLRRGGLGWQSRGHGACIAPLPRGRCVCPCGW